MIRDQRYIAIKRDDFPSECDYCGEEVWWGVTYKGKRATFDEDWWFHLNRCPGILSSEKQNRSHP